MATCCCRSTRTAGSRAPESIWARSASRCTRWTTWPACCSSKRRRGRWSATGSDARRQAAVHHALRAFVRVRGARRSPGGLSDQLRLERIADRPAADAHAGRRHRRVAVLDDPGRPAGTAAHVDRRRDPDGGGRRDVRLDARLPAPRRGGDDRGHQSQRERSRAVLADRAGRSGPRCALRRENRRVRLVHAGGLARDRRGLAVRRRTVAGAAADGGDTARELSRRRAVVRRVGCRLGRVVHAALPGDRGRCAGRHDDSLWHRPLARRGAPPVRPVRARRVCRWLRDPELRGVLVLSPINAFAGGFVIQSFAAYWFYLRFGVNPATLGMIFFWANVFAGVSALLASRLAARFGLVRTMVFTHLPSNVLLILVPLMPTLPLAVLVLLARFSISQMDVPTRQSYVMAVVRPDERSAAAGITGVARTTGAAIAPVFAGWMFARPSLVSVPFFIAGTLKIVYDLLLYRGFVSAPERSE